MTEITEHQIEQAICQLLHHQGWYVVKLKDQTAAHNGKHQAALPFQYRGVADLYAIKSGFQVWIEVKTPVGRQSRDQKIFQNHIENQGGVYWLVRSVAEMKLLVQNSPVAPHTT